jgi:phosphomannomutase
MLAFMQELRKHVTVGIVGGSDQAKIAEQLGDNRECQHLCHKPLD